MCLRPICSRSCSMQRRSLASQSLDGVDSGFIIRALLSLALKLITTEYRTRRMNFSSSFQIYCPELYPPDISRSVTSDPAGAILDSVGSRGNSETIRLDD